MADSQRRLILGNGEKYVLPVTKPMSGRPTEPPRTYDEARSRVKKGFGIRWKCSTRSLQG